MDKHIKLIFSRFVKETNDKQLIKEFNQYADLINLETCVNFTIQSKLVGYTTLLESFKNRLILLTNDNNLYLKKFFTNKNIEQLFNQILNQALLNKIYKFLIQNRIFNKFCDYSMIKQSKKELFFFVEKLTCRRHVPIHDIFKYAFMWDKTKEGVTFWIKINRDFKNYIYS